MQHTYLLEGLPTLEDNMPILQRNHSIGHVTVQLGHGRDKFVDDDWIRRALCRGYGGNQFLANMNLGKCGRSAGHDDAREDFAWHNG